jgi:hypothetical protein
MENVNRKMNSFNSSDRKDALNELLNQHPIFHPESSNVNLHFHSFNSYNSENWSPTRIACESKLRGLYATGIIDFDVIDGRDEFLEASELLGLRASVGIETRTFLTEYSHLEIDSPGEPGVSYIAGSGFVNPFAEGSSQAITLAEYRNKALERNLALVGRINGKMPEIAIDYLTDVVPLTPSGNATERHIIQAYIQKSIKQNSDKKVLYELWSQVLGKAAIEVEAAFQNMSSLEDLVRARLAKKGGVGYVQPTADTFPKVEDFFAWTRSCGAVPLESWLDGTSRGEEDGKALLELSREKGAMGLNIIPDRNWNIMDLELKALKYNKLKEIVQIADQMDFPIQIGTEMNKAGLPFADDLEGEYLKPFKNSFLNGAKILIGHAVLQRFAGFSYSSAETDDFFNHNLKHKNEFFASVGELPPVNRTIADILRNAGKEQPFTIIQDALKKGKW